MQKLLVRVRGGQTMWQLSLFILNSLSWRHILILTATASPGVKKCSASLEKHSERLLLKCDLFVFKQNTIWGIKYYLDIITRM